MLVIEFVGRIAVGDKRELMKQRETGSDLVTVDRIRVALCFPAERVHDDPGQRLAGLSGNLRRESVRLWILNVEWLFRGRHGSILHQEEEYGVI